MFFIQRLQAKKTKPKQNLFLNLWLQYPKLITIEYLNKYLVWKDKQETKA